MGGFQGSLSDVSAPNLGATAIKAALSNSGLTADDISEVIMGNVLPAGLGQAPARQAAVNGGVPATIPALTINKVCGSGLKAVMLAAQAVRAGDARLVLAGGMESMSNVPFYARGLRDGVKLGNQMLEDGLIHDGLWCSFGDCHMGGHAEYTADKAGVTRSDADEFSLRSHQKAVEATREGRFRNEIVPVEVEGRKQVTVVDTDEGPRRDTTAEALARLPPAFPKDATQEIDELVVTAGNAPGLNDGAAAVVVASLEYAEAHGLEVDAFISAYAVSATEPQDLFFAPIAAVNNLMQKEGKEIGDYELVEVNVVVCRRRHRLTHLGQHDRAADDRLGSNAVDQGTDTERFVSRNAFAHETDHRFRVSIFN